MKHVRTETGTGYSMDKKPAGAGDRTSGRLASEKVRFPNVFSFQTQVLGEFNQSAVWNAFSSLRNL